MLSLPHGTRWVSGTWKSGSLEPASGYPQQPDRHPAANQTANGSLNFAAANFLRQEAHWDRATCGVESRGAGFAGGANGGQTNHVNGVADCRCGTSPQRGMMALPPIVQGERMRVFAAYHRSPSTRPDGALAATREVVVAAAVHSRRSRFGRRRARETDWETWSPYVPSARLAVVPPWSMPSMRPVDFGFGARQSSQQIVVHEFSMGVVPGPEQQPRPRHFGPAGRRQFHRLNHLPGTVAAARLPTWVRRTE